MIINLAMPIFQIILYSWTPPKNHFHGINFRKFYYSAILHHIIYNFANFIFANLKKSRKEQKLLALKVSGYTVYAVSPLPPTFQKLSLHPWQGISDRYVLDKNIYLSVTNWVRGLYVCISKKVYVKNNLFLPLQINERKIICKI